MNIDEAKEVYDSLLIELSVLNYDRKGIAKYDRNAKNEDCFKMDLVYFLLYLSQTDGEVSTAGVDYIKDFFNDAFVDRIIDEKPYLGRVMSEIPLSFVTVVDKHVYDLTFNMEGMFYSVLWEKYLALLGYLGMGVATADNITQMENQTLLDYLKMLRDYAEFRTHKKTD